MKFFNLVEMKNGVTYVLFLLILFPGSTFGQDHPFYMYGEIWDIDTRQILVNSSVKATDTNDTTLIMWGRVDGKGRFDLELPFDHSFKVEFFSPGYLSKFVLMELHGVDAKRRQGDHGMNVQASLIRPLEEVDYQLLSSQPFGICRLNEKGRSFIWDKEYSSSSSVGFQELMDRHTARLKELGE